MQNSFQRPSLLRGFYDLPISRKTQLMTLLTFLSLAGVIGLGSNSLSNGKVSIQENSPSALYLPKPGTKDFVLVTALEKNELRPGKINLPKADPSLLQEAVEAGGKTVWRQGKLDNQSYTLASKALLNAEGEAVAVLVSREPELAPSRLSQNSLLTQLGVLGIMLTFGWAISRAIARPIKRLQKITTDFSQGNEKVRAEVSSHDEVGQLASNFNHMADSIASNDRRIRQETEMFRFLCEMRVPYHLQQQSLDDLLAKSLLLARELIQADRLLIYRFSPDGSGTITHESVDHPWTKSLNRQIADACIPAYLMEAYRQERVAMISDLAEANLNPDHARLLEGLQVKANLVIPILKQGELFGLLIAHQCAYARQWQETEINFLKQFVTQLQVTLDRVSWQQQQSLESRLSQLLKQITLKISHVFNAQALFEVVVEESRQALNGDRAIIYCFNENWQGTIIAEAIANNFPSALGAVIADPCFAQRYVETYRQGRVQATDDIYKAGLTDCHLKQLEPFAVKANLVAPVIIAGELFGLLIVHQCSAPRHWQPAEIDFFTQVAMQVGVALERANLLNEQTLAGSEQRFAKEALQRRALELLMEVDPVSRGDLTIRAKVTEDEIGTIADSYNATIENLRQIVTQVQGVTQQMASTTTSNETAIQGFSLEALRQVQDLSLAQEQIEAMTTSIEAVAVNAQQALSVVQQANQTVEAGESAMNQTVDGMLAIRETTSETTQKLYHLGESSQKISKVVSLIGRFAAQTHLLALKASIEAARAGEEGRGFAVIADEVRSLAAQSAEATAEIDTLVVNIQSETKAVAKTMELGTKQVLLGSQLLETTRTSLNQVTAASGEISRLIEAIAFATVEQSQTSTAVSQVMGEVVAIAHNTSNSASDVSDSFKELLVMAEHLQDRIGQFKVT